jgi:hypothetical protein
MAIRSRGPVLGAAVVLAILLVAAVVALLVPRAAADQGLPPGVLPTGAAVPQAAGSQTRYRAIAGSATHLLMATENRDTGVPVTGREDGRTRSVLRSDGRVVPVPPNWQASLLGDVPLFVHLDTERLDLSKTTGISWRLPEAGGSGTVPTPAGTRLLALAPGGWVTARQIGFNPERNAGAVLRLTRYRTSGARTDLGVPFPDGAPFAVQATDAGVLAWSDPSDGGDSVPDGRIEYRPWSGGGWRLLDPGDPERAELGCTQPSTALVACGADGDRGLRVYALPHGATRDLARSTCDDPSVATTTGFLTIEISRPHSSCRAGRLVFIAKDGTTTRSTAVYDRFHTPVLAFGRIIVGEAGEHRLLALRTAQDEHPRVVAGR